MVTSKKNPFRKKGGAPRSAPSRLPQGTGRNDPLVQRLEHVVRIMEESSLQALAYEDADIKVDLSRTTPAAASGPPAEAPRAPHPPPETRAPDPSLARGPSAGGGDRADRGGDAEKDVVVIRSPIVGTFYRAASPGAPLFTDVGQTVKPGQTLCIIEAMKLMNEIECEVNGTILEILVENSQPVQYDDALFRVAVRP